MPSLVAKSLKSLPFQQQLSRRRSSSDLGGEGGGGTRSSLGKEVGGGERLQGGPSGAGGGESSGRQKERQGRESARAKGRRGGGAEQGGKLSPWVTSEGGREGRRQGDPRVQPELAVVVAPAHLAPRAGGWQGAVLGQTCLPGAPLQGGRGWARVAQRSSVWLGVGWGGVCSAVLCCGGAPDGPRGWGRASSPWGHQWLQGDT